MQDYSEVTSVLGGSKKGISEITWNVDALSQLGITATSNFSGTVDPFQARSILTLTAGQSAPATARVSAVAKDVEGCTSTISFDVSIEQAKTNEKPVPRFRYNAGAGVKSATNGANVEVSAGQVELDAGASTDDGGVAGLTYRWSLAGQANLSASSGEKVTLAIPDSTTGPVTITLTVTDTGGLSSTMTVAFKLVAANEAPVARIQYDPGSGNWTQLMDGSTTEVTATAVKLDAGESSDDAGADGLQYSWAFAGKGTLTASTGQLTTLNIEDGNPDVLTVTLTVRDAGSLSSSTTVAFKLVASNEAPVAAVKFDTEGQGNYSGPFTENQSLDATSGTIELDASGSTDDGGADQLSYQWSASGIEGAALSSDNGASTTLTVPAGSTGSAVVVLTATDGGGATDQVQVTFRFAATAEKPEAQITSAPTSVQAGEEMAVEGAASGGTGTGDYRYVWTASATGDQAVEIYSTGSRARLFAPSLDSLDPETLTVTLTVFKDGVASDPASVDITVTGPTLYFSQLAVGEIDDQMEFQTSVVLVNNSDATAHGRITLVNNQYGDSWSVRVNGEYRSDFPVDIGPAGSVKFVLSGDQVEVGWLSLESNVPLTGHLFYQVVEKRTGRALREVPILPTTARGFRTALDAGQNDNLAVALVNVGDDEIRFRLVVQSNQGGAMETGEFVLGPRQHLAQFLGELFDGGQNGALIPASFAGGTMMIEITGGSGDLAATIMKTDEGLPLSILPVGTW
jgi:hypothetical protein